MAELTPEARRNRGLWTQSNADYTAGNAPAAWACAEMDWGIWNLPESELKIFAGIGPGGHLVFLRNSTLVILCSEDEVPAVERLVNPQFGMHRFEWPEGGVESHLAHGEWIRLLCEHGFEIEALHEVQAPRDARTHETYDYVTAEWGRKWPAAEIWRARKS